MPTPTTPVQFASTQYQDYKRIEEQIKVRDIDGYFKGGIVAEEVIDRVTKEKTTLVHIANPYEDTPVIKTFPSRCTVEQIEKIRDSILPMAESCRILSKIATAYEMRRPLVIVGDTAIGKTYLVNKFNELLYGPDVPPLDFYCSGQTDVAELMGRWVPSLETQEQQETWLKFIDSELGRSRMATIAGEATNSAVAPEERQAQLLARLADLAAELGFSDRTTWAFELGAVPKAFTAHIDESGRYTFKPGGEGAILKIDEVGLAQATVIAALLEIRGDHGKLANWIQLWENSGHSVAKGKNTWVVFTTNPVEQGGYQERHHLDPALAGHVLWHHEGSLERDSLLLAATRYFDYRMGNRPAATPRNCLLPLYDYKEITRELAEIAGNFHNQFVSATGTGEVGGRQQKIPATLDDMARLSEYLVRNQVRSPLTGQVDLAETLRRGVQLIYLCRIADPQLKERLKGTFEAVLSDSTLGSKNFRGSLVTREQILKTLVQETATREGTEAEQAAALQKEEALIKRLCEKNPDETFKGGLAGEEVLDPKTGRVTERLLHLTDPYETPPTIKTFPTRCTPRTD